ncbi:S1C family serine protease [Thermostaphylospora chromogena]|uniref:Putative serine protease PepD n=1 Tax=Thermostaphylospora chromogena TaxID=35622 RepID=A0A1H1AZN2_9ACTN|nr:trypsin-like peptidase domain-containing protein [Thermostaphylospora chromogena]SDQ45178.1 putative serine protease PepD [Thermostaphylospora chromogena]
MTDEMRTGSEWEGEGRRPSDYPGSGESPFARSGFRPVDESVSQDHDHGRGGNGEDASEAASHQEGDRGPVDHGEERREPDREEGGPYAAGRSAPGFGDVPSSGEAVSRPVTVMPMYGPTPPPPTRALGLGPDWAPPPVPGSGGGVGAGGNRRVPRLSTLVVLGMVIALVASVVSSVGTYLLTRPDDSGTDPSYSLETAPLNRVERAPDSVAGVAARVLPSVVSLDVQGARAAGTGSGFLIKGGYIVTNNHVVAAAVQGGEIRIQYNNRKTSIGRIVGRDPGSDLAVVKPDDDYGMPQIPLGNSDEVQVGDPVIAIGSPLGLSGTVTTGIVSSLNRPVIAGGESGAMDTSYINAIQTDAAINPGNSGGPLVNSAGQVIGVNSAIATLSESMTDQGGSIGLGFAIPVNHVRRVVEEIINTGSAKTSRIGIRIDVTYTGEGVRIASEAEQGLSPVEEGGPADKAGLKPGDIILEVDGTAVQNSQELIVLIRSKAPGDRIQVRFQRGGQELTTTVEVAASSVPVPQPS